MPQSSLESPSPAHGPAIRPATRWVLVLLLLHVLPFAVRPALIGGDEPHYALMAHSIAADGDLSLEDDYREVEAGSPAAGRKRAGETLDRHLLEQDGERVFSHPLGLPVLAAPLLAIQRAISPGAAPDLVLGLMVLGLTFVALLAGWRLLADRTGSPRLATAGLLLLYFSTPLWFYSRTFFTEPILWALLVLAAATLARNPPSLLGRLTAGALLGLAFLVKETVALLTLPFLLSRWIRHGTRDALAVAAGPALALGVFAAKNLALTGCPLTTFQPFQLGDPLTGTVALLVGAKAGLLWFAPTVLLLGAAALRPASEAWWRRPEVHGVVAFVGFFALTAAWIDPKGGSGFGPRLLMPALVALGPALLTVLTRSATSRHGLPTALRFAASLGCGVQLAAVTEPVTAFWSLPVTELLADRWPVVLVGAGVAWWLLGRWLGPSADSRGSR